MIRDITIGQYYPADSVIHRLDPRTKLVGTMVFIIALFLADNSSSGFGDWKQQGSLPLYCQGIESHSSVIADQRQL